jgi:hypothetical protein
LTLRRPVDRPDGVEIGAAVEVLRIVSVFRPEAHGELFDTSLAGAKRVELATEGGEPFRSVRDPGVFD